MMGAGMTSTSVGEAWRLALPPETKLLAGRSSLDRPVVWARRMSPQPPAFASLESDELALLSVEAISFLDERLTLARIVEGLAQRAAAGLAVVGSVSTKAVTSGERHGIPIFQLPEDSDLRDVERDVIRLVMEREAQLDRRGREIYVQLAHLTIGGRGLQAIAEALARVTAKPILIYDSWQDASTLACPEGPVPREVLERWSRSGGLKELAGALPASQSSSQEIALGDLRLAYRASPIIIDGMASGVLVLLCEPGRFDDLDRLALERGALVCAVEMVKQRAVAAAEDRLRGDFLDLVLTAGPTEVRALSRRGHEMGYPLEGHHVVVRFGIEGGEGELVARAASECRARLLNTGIYAFLAVYEENLVLLCGADAAETLRQIESLAELTVEALSERRCSQDAPQHLVAGVGRQAEGLAGLRRSYAQASEARNLALSLFEHDRVLAFGDLGVYRLLCGLRDSAELDDFYEQTLGPLIAYDASRDTELVHTLSAFFAHQGNVSQTAESLHLHRNSLLYRLERLEELTELDLGDPDDCFALQLALKVRPLLDAV